MSLEGIEDLYPLAPTQAGMVYHSLVDPDAGVYVGQFCFRLEGAIDCELMERTWDKLVERHEALRVSILWGELSQPLQAVHREVVVPWQHYDWRDLSVPEQDTAFEAWKAADRCQGFQIDKPPLMRMALMRLENDRYWLVWTSHHAVADGWSASVLLRDMQVIYDSLITGVAAELPPPFKYSRHIAWIESQDMGAAKRYWSERLAGFLEPTAVQTPKLHGQHSASGHGAARRVLEREPSAALRALARSCEVSLYTVLQAAWGLLLHRYSDASDVVFGVTTSGRPADLDGIQSAVGLFINTLPVRHTFVDEVSLADWLRRLQADSLELMKYEFSPLPRVNEWSEVGSGTALFDTILVMANFPKDYAEAGSSCGWQVSVAEVVHYSNYGLAFVATPGDELELELVFDQGQYSDTVADAMLTDLAGILYAMGCDGADVKLSSLGPPSAADLVRLTCELGCTEALAHPPVDVLELFASRVLATPDRTAVCCGDSEFTYEELDARAGQIARALRDMGCAPGDRVALLLERSVDFASAVLAVLRLGAAYVAVDPRAPGGRIEYILADARCRIVVTEGAPVFSVKASDPQLLQLQFLAESPPGGSSGDEPLVVAEDSLAYILYTSGSTGNPKGVAVTRANLAFSNASRMSYYGDDPDSFLLLSAFWFDSSVAGLFWTLTTGGRLVIAEHRLEQDMAALADTLADHGVTHTLCLPSLYRAMLEHLPPGALDSLRLVITAGEPLAPSLLSVHRCQVPHAKIVNEYGPTEATVWVTAFDATDWSEPAAVPIGRPIPGAGVCILDKRRRLAPIGVGGELCITGPGVAAGYIGNRVETDERFIDDPLRPGERRTAYLTGDRARFLPSGNIEFLGRLDDQVKIRGHRIEPAEIEFNLLQHPGVEDAAVMVMDRGAGDVDAMFAQRGGSGMQSVMPPSLRTPRIIAWISPARSAPGDRGAPTAEYRDFLRMRLPDYMIPAHIETVDAIPRLSNGKIDRVALQHIPRAQVEEPAATASTLEDDVELSRLMGIIRAIWSDVLECGDVREDDDFFELGGDSLTSINVVARAAEQGVVLKPGDLFDFPKLLELCSHLVEEGRVNAVAVEEATGPIVRSKNVDGSRRPFFMVHGGGRLLAQLRDALGAEQPIHLLSAHWEDANLAHDIDLDELAAEALAVLLEMQPQGPYQLGGYSFGAVIAFEIARILSLRGEVVDMLFMLDPPENPGVFHTVPAGCGDLQRQRADASVNSGRGDEWQGLGLVGMARHALGKLGNHCRHYASRLAINARYTYALGCLSVGRPVPPELRKLYVFRRYLAAAGRYDLRSVDCPVLLYRARRGYHKYGPALWLALAEGGITLVEFDCEHDDLQWNPATVEEWTRQFAVQLASPGAPPAL